MSDDEGARQGRRLSGAFRVLAGAALVGYQIFLLTMLPTSPSFGYVMGAEFLFLPGIVGVYAFVRGFKLWSENAPRG